MRDGDPPIGTEVMVFRADGRTVIGKGVIEAWVLFSEIEDDENEIVVDASPIGQQLEIEEEDGISIVLEDGSEISVEEALATLELDTPRIRLEDGRIIYGSGCYWELLSEYQNPECN